MNNLPVGDDSFRAPSPVVRTPQRFEDERGWFFESFHLQRYDTLALNQANESQRSPTGAAPIRRRLHSVEPAIGSRFLVGGVVLSS